MRRVEKYGGTSMAQPHIVLERVRRTDPDVVVVSAPGRDVNKPGAYMSPLGLEKMTNLLKRGELSAVMNRADEVVGRSGLTGEQQSVVLDRFRAWLDMHGGHEAGRMAAGEYLSACIMSEATGRALLDPTELIYICPDKTPEISLSVRALKRTLLAGKRYVLPGFYGRGADRNAPLEVLSRGGSDTTGALATLALGAVYHNLSDSTGIYTKDPNLYADARRIDRMTYTEAADVAAGGAAILHAEVSRILSGSECETVVASTFDSAGYTRISDIEDTGRRMYAAESAYSAL